MTQKDVLKIIFESSPSGFIKQKPEVEKKSLSEYLSSYRLEKLSTYRLNKMK